MYRYTFRGIEYIETEEGQLKWVTEDRNCRFTCHVDHIDDVVAVPLSDIVVVPVPVLVLDPTPPTSFYLITRGSSSVVEWLSGWLGFRGCG